MRSVNRELSLNEVLNVTQVLAFIRFVAETECLSAGSCTAGSSDPVHIRFRNVGQFEVDDMAQLIDVNSTRSNIGRDQYANLAFFESVHGPVPLWLAFVAMNGFGLDA
tara:strand:+ start:2473 stop:2796 length:324 start_codon:yes stop_codon:yes gene_type:complete